MRTQIHVIAVQKKAYKIEDEKTKQVKEGFSYKVGFQADKDELPQVEACTEAIFEMLKANIGKRVDVNFTVSTFQDKSRILIG